MNFFLRRIREPSTWAGIAALLAVAGVPGVVISVLGPGLDIAAGMLGTATVAVPALVAIALPERTEDGAP